MEEQNHQHIVSYRTYIVILLCLLTFTALSVLVTAFDLGPLAVSAALFFAAAKSMLVLLYFMHLKFDQPIYRIMVSVVLSIFIAVLVLTWLDFKIR